MINYKWCTYSWSNKELPQHIGKMYNVRGNTCDIQYSDGQLYPKSAWDMDYVKVFDTLEEAICFMYTNSNYGFLSEIKEELTSYFPKDTENVNWNIVLRPLKIKKVTKK
jgi:hypothetical protein